MPPNGDTPENDIGLPTKNPEVLKHVITLAVLVAVTIVVSVGAVTVINGMLAYPRINPASFISKPGGNIPSITRIVVGLDGIGLLYLIGISTQMLSSVLRSVPDGVVNSGNAEPEIIIENDLSLIFCKLSVARTANEYTISAVTSSGVPDILPSASIDIPSGMAPLSNLQVTLIAGKAACTSSCSLVYTEEGYVPNIPAGVIQFGCAMLSL